MDEKLAPIILFVYDRPDHTKKTIEALKANELSNDSDLIIFSDGPKDKLAFAGVSQVREYLKGVHGFKSIEVVERSENWGLAKSIISGVTEVVAKYGKVIVLEDDIVTSPLFLTFMNGALNHFRFEKKVWHVSGWNYQMNPEGLGDVFFWRLMNCWGWATWDDRWRYFEKNTEDILNDFTDDDIFKFDIDGSGSFWRQVQLNSQGKINTWAVYWYASIFKNGGLCLNPTRTFVQNVGLDGSGVHCGKEEVLHIELSTTQIKRFDLEVEESELAVRRFKELSKAGKNKGFYYRLINKVRRCFNGY